LIDVYRTWTTQLVQEGFVGLAVDEVGLDRIKAWIEWLKRDPRTSGKVGVVGWSSGADLALTVSRVTPVEATVLYVGLYTGTDLSRLKGPMLGHFGEHDPQYPKDKVETFERQMKRAGKSLEIHWYPGDHYFPFPNRPSYDKASADAAWVRTMNFLHKNLQ
jgi:carboxymethylenebutenolidase